MKNKKLLLISGLAGIIGVITVAFFYLPVTKSSDKATNLASQPDQYVNDATLYAFDRSGTMKSLLKAQKMVHFQDKNTTFFTKPHVATYTEKRIPWYINAQKAMTQTKEEVIYLWGNVVIKQLSVDNKLETTILTDQVAYYTQAGLLKSDSQVTIMRPGVHLTAQGMTVNLKKGIVKTQARSRGNYDQQTVH